MTRTGAGLLLECRGRQRNGEFVVMLEDVDKLVWGLVSEVGFDVGRELRSEKGRGEVSGTGRGGKLTLIASDHKHDKGPRIGVFWMPSLCTNNKCTTINTRLMF